MNAEFKNWSVTWHPAVWILGPLKLMLLCSKEYPGRACLAQKNSGNWWTCLRLEPGTWNNIWPKSSHQVESAYTCLTSIPEFPWHRRTPSFCGLCFRDHGEPETCVPVHLSISPLEATETAYVGDEEKEIRRNRETVRVTLTMACLGNSSQEFSTEFTNVTRF